MTLSRIELKIYIGHNICIELKNENKKHYIFRKLKSFIRNYYPKISSNSVLMSWDAPPRPNGQILDYETILSAQQDSFELTNVTISRNIRITGLQADSTYTFKVNRRRISLIE